MKSFIKCHTEYWAYNFEDRYIKETELLIITFLNHMSYFANKFIYEFMKKKKLIVFNSS